MSSKAKGARGKHGGGGGGGGKSEGEKESSAKRCKKCTALLPMMYKMKDKLAELHPQCNQYKVRVLAVKGTTEIVPTVGGCAAVCWCPCLRPYKAKGVACNAQSQGCCKDILTLMKVIAQVLGGSYGRSPGPTLPPISYLLVLVSSSSTPPPSRTNTDAQSGAAIGWSLYLSSPLRTQRYVGLTLPVRLSPAAVAHVRFLAMIRCSWSSELSEPRTRSSGVSSRCPPLQERRLGEPHPP